MTAPDSKMMKQTFYVNSHRNWRNSGTDSDFVYEMNIDDSMEFDHAVVLSANIPKSWYNVPDGSNYFTLTEDGKSSTIELDVGNYSRQQLAGQLTTKLTAGSPNGYTYACSYNLSNNTPETGHLFFSVTGNNGVQPIFTFEDIMWDQMGFQPDSSNQFANDLLESTDVIKLAQEDTILLYSDLVNGGDENLLQEFMLGSSVPFTTAEYTCPDIHAHSRPISKTRSKQFKFSLTDENGTLLNLNGKNFVFTIMLFRDIDVKNGKNVSPIAESRLALTDKLFENQKKKQGVNAPSETPQIPLENPDQ
jgi:hypothetical protein